MYLVFMLGRQNRHSLLWLVLSRHFQNFDKERNYIQDQFEHLNREKIVGKTTPFFLKVQTCLSISYFQNPAGAVSGKGQTPVTVL